MRFARIPAADSWPPPGLDQYLAAAEIELLQLDYALPRSLPAGTDTVVGYADFATGLGRVISGLGKLLFLEPRLRIVTNGGWGHAYGCVESVAQELVGGGCGDVMVSAVRGGNLLPILDMLELEGVDLAHSVTGATLGELRKPVLAASLKLGAGPLLTAMSEGARVIIAGSYDGAAPVMAAGAAEFGWEWSDHDLLAGACAASQAVLAPVGWGEFDFDLPSAQWLAPRGELAPDGSCLLRWGNPLDQEEARRVEDWLRGSGGPTPGSARSDVVCDFGTTRCVPQASADCQLQGATGSAGKGQWDLEILYQAGFSAVAVIGVEARGSASTENVSAALQARLTAGKDVRTHVAVRPLWSPSTAGSSADSLSWLHAECHSAGRQGCAEFVEAVQELVSCKGSLLSWPAGPPTLTARCEAWPCRVPRDAVDLAVDTRPAREWQ
jgi:hypothetical protein